MEAVSLIERRAVPFAEVLHALQVGIGLELGAVGFRDLHLGLHSGHTEEKRQSKERILHRHVPKEEVAEEELYCIQNSIAIYIIYLIYIDFNCLQSCGAELASKNP